MLGTIIGWIIVGLLLWFLYKIVRMSIISPLRTKDASARLRSPDLTAVAGVVNFIPPPGLAEFYKHSPWVDRKEFTLVDISQKPSTRWPIGAFVPLTAIDTKENMKIFGISGIPIADDLDKGVYYVDASGSVMLFSPDLPERHRRVAPSVEVFATFRPAREEE